ncbi:MAG: hypothetical protein KAU20_02345 [Nanoarchaeota archaeon]|nr:hypothetical protein [Nanoarchaeota archaeon]
MYWFKHIARSTSDPDILESIFTFGSDGYFVFFNTLEVLSRENCVEKPLSINFDAYHSYFPRVTKRKLKEILTFFEGKKRFFLKKNSKKIPFFDKSFSISCNKLSALSDTYTKNVRRKLSQSDNNVSNKKQNKKRTKKNKQKKIAPDKKGEQKKGKSPPEMMPFMINGQGIEKRFHHNLIKDHGNWNAERYYYRARNARNVKAYITGGLKDDPAGKLGYIKQAKAEESDHPERVQTWIKETIHGIKVIKLPDGKESETRPIQSIGQIIDDLSENKLN